MWIRLDVAIGDDRTVTAIEPRAPSRTRDWLGWIPLAE